MDDSLGTIEEELEQLDISTGGKTLRMSNLGIILGKTRGIFFGQIWELFWVKLGEYFGQNKGSILGKTRGVFWAKLGEYFGHI